MTPGIALFLIHAALAEFAGDVVVEMNARPWRRGRTQALVARLRAQRARRLARRAAR